MQRTHNYLHKLFSKILLSIALSACFLPPSASAINESEFYLITDHQNAENTTIKRRTLQSIFSMRALSWPNGDALTVFVLPDDASSHQKFCVEVLRILPHHLRRNWDRLIFSGKAGAPIKVSSFDEMKTRVANTPGAIGYIPKSHIDDSISIMKVK